MVPSNLGCASAVLAAITKFAPSFAAADKYALRKAPSNRFVLELWRKITFEGDSLANAAGSSGDEDRFSNQFPASINQSAEQSISLKDKQRDTNSSQTNENSYPVLYIVLWWGPKKIEIYFSSITK